MQPLQLHEVAAAADPGDAPFQVVKADLGRVDVKLGQTGHGGAGPGQWQCREAADDGPDRAGRQSQVWVLDPSGMTVNAVPVQIAGAVAMRVVIAAGLARTEVVVAGYYRLSPGPEGQSLPAPPCRRCTASGRRCPRTDRGPPSRTTTEPTGSTWSRWALGTRR